MFSLKIIIGVAVFLFIILLILIGRRAQRFKGSDNNPQADFINAILGNNMGERVGPGRVKCPRCGAVLDVEEDLDGLLNKADSVVGDTDSVKEALRQRKMTGSPQLFLCIKCNTTFGLS